MVQRSFAVRASMRAMLLAALVLLGPADTALATGFFTHQQGVMGLGRVGAGNAAIARAIENKVWPLLAAGKIRPLIDDESTKTYITA